MTPTAEQLLRNAISTETVSLSDMWASVTVAARELAGAIQAEDYKEIERHALYIADITSFLKGRAVA